MTGRELQACVAIPPEWTMHALCAQTDPEVFYPEKGRPTRPPRERQALQKEQRAA